MTVIAHFDGLSLSETFAPVSSTASGVRLYPVEAEDIRKKLNHVGAWGCVVYGPSVLRIAIGSIPVHNKHGFLGEGWTNNMAEYRGAIEAVKFANELYPDDPKVLRGDSQLVIYQATGRYQVREPKLIPLREELLSALGPLRRTEAWRSSTPPPSGAWTLEWVPRGQNSAADRECNLAAQEAGYR